MEWGWDNARALIGIALIFAIGWALSENRSRFLLWKRPCNTPPGQSSPTGANRLQKSPARNYYTASSGISLEVDWWR